MNYSAYIIYNRFESIRNKFFIDCFFYEAKKLNIDLELLIEEDLNISIIDSKLKILYNDEELKKCDFVIMRTVNYELSKQFEYMGIRVFNNSQISLIANNKYLSYQLVSSLGINILNTELVINNDLDKIKKFPKVIKPLSEKGGKDVYLINNKNDLDSIERFQYNKFVIQIVANNFGKDVRVYVVGNKIIKAMIRKSKNSFKSNFCINNEAEEYTLNNDEINIVNKIINSIKPDFVGIDFVFNDNKIYFNEIEDVVGCRMLYQLTDINIVKIYLEYILDNIKN